MLKISLSSLFKLFTSLLKLGIKKTDSKRKKKRKIQEKCKENKKMVEQVGAVEKGKGCVLV